MMGILGLFSLAQITEFSGWLFDFLNYRKKNIEKSKINEEENNLGGNYIYIKITSAKYCL